MVRGSLSWLALVILAPACGGPVGAALEDPAPRLPAAAAAEVERPWHRRAPPDGFPAPAPVVPEVPFPCVPEGSAVGPAWSFHLEAHGAAVLVAGDELLVVGVEPHPVLAALSLATGEARLRVPLADGLFPLAAAPGLVFLGRSGDAPLLEARDLGDGATLWTAELGPGPRRLVAADEARVVLREGPEAGGAFRLAALDALTGAPLWSREFGPALADVPPHVLRSDDRLVVSYTSGGGGQLYTTLAAVALEDGELLWTRRAEGRLERILADAEGRLHVGLRAGVDPAAPGAGYVLSLHRDGVTRWALKRTTIEGPGNAPLLDGPALAGPDRLLLVAAELLEGSTGATIGHAPFAAPASFRVAGRSAFGVVSRTAWFDAALYGLDLDSGRPRFAIRQGDGGPRWHLAGTAATGAGSLLAAFSVVQESGELASLCELDADGRALRAVRLAAPPADGNASDAFAAGDRWIQVIEVARPWPEGPAVELRAFDLAGFSPPEPPRPLGGCSGEVSDTCG